MGINEVIIILFFLSFIGCILWQVFKNKRLILANFELNSNSYILYLLSLFIPLVGIIVGSIKISKDDNINKNIGMNCIIFGVISIILSAILIIK